MTQIAQIPGYEHVSLLNIISVTIPATFCGTLALSLYSLRRGKELGRRQRISTHLQDPVWRERIRTTTTSLNDELPSTAKWSVYLFILALITVVVIAMLPEIRTIGTGKPIKMSLIIQIMMLCFGGNYFTCDYLNHKLYQMALYSNPGMVAAIAIFGIAWMSDTYFQYAMPSFKAAVTSMVEHYPWTIICTRIVCSFCCD